MILFFRIGAYGLVLTAVFHLIGHFSGYPPPANETEAQLLDMASTYAFMITGLRRTLMDFLNGYSLAFAAFAFFTGVINVVSAHFHQNHVRFMTVISAVNVAMCGVLVALSAGYFIYPPLVAFGVCFLAFAAALFTGARRA